YGCPPITWRDRRHRGTSPLAGDHAGPKLGCRLRQYRTLCTTAGTGGFGGTQPMGRSYRRERLVRNVGQKEEFVAGKKFEGASAIVSGGAGGLGEATVRRLHAEGLGVVIADLADDKGKALADELGSRAAFVRTDVTSDDSV